MKGKDRSRMTGQEFKELVRQCGSQIMVARSLGVEPDTIRARYNETTVPAVYEYAIIGLRMRLVSTPDLGLFMAPTAQ